MRPSLRPAITAAMDEGGGQAETGLPSGSHSPGPSYHLGSQRCLLTGAREQNAERGDS